MSQYLQEAFKKFEILDEEDFNLSASGIEDMKSFVDNDEKVDFTDVIDPSAETEEEVEDSYIGKIILDCKVCHSKIYKNVDEVVMSDEGTDETVANVGEECPFCFSVDGFDVVGQVAPYSETEVEVEVEPKDEEEVEVEVDETEEETVNESLENLDIETEHDKIHVEAEEKVSESDEMIAPLTDEQKVEIEDNGVEEEPLEAPEEEEASMSGEDEEVDYEMTDFDEDSFNELGESYLKRVYENVESFKSSQVRCSGNSLIVEGIITFKSGNKKNTSFKFEAKNCNKDNKVRFIGENLEITRGKKCFTLNGSINDKKLVSESLNYNYRVKGNRVYGTVRVAEGLSDKEGTASNAMAKSMEALANCKTVEDVINYAKNIIPAKKANEPKVKKLLSITLPKCKDVAKAQAAVTNFILKGDGLGVIK